MAGAFAGETGLEGKLSGQGFANERVAVLAEDLEEDQGLDFLTH